MYGSISAVAQCVSDLSAGVALQVRLHTTPAFNQKLSYSPHASEKQAEN